MGELRMIKPKRITTISQAIDAMGGRDVVAERCCITTAAVDRWVEADFIPPGWHLRFYVWLTKRGFEPSLQGVFGMSRASW